MRAHPSFFDQHEKNKLWTSEEAPETLMWTAMQQRASPKEEVTSWVRIGAVAGLEVCWKLLVPPSLLGQHFWGMECVCNANDYFLSLLKGREVLGHH